MTNFINLKSGTAAAGTGAGQPASQGGGKDASTLVGLLTGLGALRSAGETFIGVGRHNAAQKEAGSLISQLRIRLGDETGTASRVLQERLGTIRNRAAASGVSGAGLDNLMGDLAADAARDHQARVANLRNNVAAIRAQADATKVDPFVAAVSMFGDVLGGALEGKQLELSLDQLQRAEEAIQIEQGQVNERVDSISSVNTPRWRPFYQRVGTGGGFA